jgi:muramoyltetrapeptide carboxypeptidase
LIEELKKPVGLRPNDTLAIWAPSFPGPTVFPRRFQRGVEALRAAGFAIELAPSCGKHVGYAAAAPEELAAELHSLLADSHIAGIICAVGGWTINALLPFVDWQLVRNSWKVVVGYSDISAFLLAALAQSRVVAFHGPMVISEWGEMDGPWTYTSEQFLHVTMQPEAPGVFYPPRAWTDELLWWERDDHQRRRASGSGEWRFLREGQATGPLIAGCIPTLAQLIGTPYLPDVTGAILCLEAEAFTPDRFWAHLQQWRQIGALDKIAGLVIGRQCRPQPMATGYADFDALLLQTLGDHDIPVLVDVDFGHTEPMLTLPIGVTALLDSRTAAFAITEAAVTLFPEIT